MTRIKTLPVSRKYSLVRGLLFVIELDTEKYQAIANPGANPSMMTCAGPHRPLISAANIPKNRKTKKSKKRLTLVCAPE
jgi:hypothetical protein